MNIALISEPYQGSVFPKCMAHDANRTAIWVLNGRRVSGHGTGEDYMWIIVHNVTYVNVYINNTEALADTLWEIHGDLIVYGGFNARGVECGMPYTNRRSKILLDTTARLGIVVIN